jgi:tetraacyldisaccharide 4'-kinase
MDRQRLFDIMSGADRSLAAGLWRSGLSLLEWPYRGAVAIRNGMFDSGLRRPRELPGLTISVGNLTAGGTGKTPMVAELVRRLVAMGARPAILMRGYMPDGGGPSDEQAEYAAALGELAGQVPVVADPNRALAAARALHEQPSVNVFLLDDGFQHRQVHRDLDLVLLDATAPFGHEHVLPRGLLREPAMNLVRATAVIVTRADQCPDLAELHRRIEAITGSMPLAHAVHHWAGWQVGDSEALQPLTLLKDQPVAGACGIGNPGAFRATLERHVAKVVHFQAFADHHAYRGEELTRLLDAAAAAGAQAVVTTAKDWVKWRRLLAGRCESTGLLLARPVLRMQVVVGGEALDALLAGALAR